MSIFGVLSLIFLLSILFFFRKKSFPKIIMFSLGILITIQLFFILQDGFVLFSLGTLISSLTISSFFVAVIILWVIVNRLLKLKNYKANLIFVIVALFLLIYTELFNGVYSFNSISEFQEYNLTLKKYYYLVPYKLIKDERINYEDTVNAYYLSLFYPTQIKRDNEGNLLYYRSRGWGEDGYWFQFGIPEGEQILSIRETVPSLIFTNRNNNQ